MSKKLDITGMKFGRLTVIKMLPSDKHGQGMCECMCSCGNIIHTHTRDVRIGHTKSCGCLANEKSIANLPKQKHGKSKNKLYRKWVAMKGRCYDVNNKSYCRYGARGITVCDEWHDFENFYSWCMSSGYDGVRTLDRIENNRGYAPNNCKWSTFKEQIKNRNNTIFVSYNDSKITLKELADIVGIPYATMYQRYNINSDIEYLTMPKKKYNHKG